MLNNFILLIAFAFCVLCEPLNAASRGGSREIAGLNVVAALSDIKGDVKLRFSLENNSATLILTQGASTPWGNLYSTSLILAVPTAVPSPLNRVHAIDDPSPNFLDIPAGSRLTGSLDLSQMFPDIDRIRKVSEILVFWSYRLRDINGVFSRRFGGMLVIPKKVAPGVIIHNKGARVNYR